MSVQIQMTQIKRFVDSLESISSESMSLLFKTRGKNMEKTEVSVPFVQKQKEKISHTSLMNSRSKCNDQIVSVGGSPFTYTHIRLTCPGW